MTAPIFILAGEASGDVLASRIMRAINRHYTQQKWVGLGGQRMAAEGLLSVDDMSRLSLIGVSAALKHYLRLLAFADELIDLVMQQRPKLILTIDAKGFSVRFAARLKRRMQRDGWSAPIIHTVAPTVWAWGMWRRRKFAQAFDGLLCLFPFEPEYFIPLGLKTCFIGHPAAFEIQAKQRKKLALTTPLKKKIVLLPGSRRSEVNYILPIMLLAVSELRRKFPNAIFTLVAAQSLKNYIVDLCVGHDIRIIDGDQHLATTLAQCDAAIVTSGTATLEAALHGAPGVACYKASWLSAMLGRMTVDMEKVILPNAILGYEVYPFLFQEKLTAENLSETLAKTLNNPRSRSMAFQRATQLRSCLMSHAKQFDDLVVEAICNWLGPDSIN